MKIDTPIKTIAETKHIDEENSNLNTKSSCTWHQHKHTKDQFVFTCAQNKKVVYFLCILILTETYMQHTDCIFCRNDIFPSPTRVSWL